MGVLNGASLTRTRGLKKLAGGGRPQGSRAAQAGNFRADPFVGVRASETASDVRYRATMPVPPASPMTRNRKKATTTPPTIRRGRFDMPRFRGASVMTVRR